MEENRTIQNRLLYRALRVLAGIMTLIAGLAISYACLAALYGEQELLIEFIDDDAASLSLNVPTILAIIATNVSAIASLGLLFFSLNRFFKHAQHGDFFIDSARNALKRLGVGMLLLYLTTRLLAVLVPVLGIPGFWAENRFSLPFFFLDLDFLYLLIGIVLLTLGQALRDGQAAKEEAKQYV